ncbi:hypothetical protein BOX08_gp47 [Pseudoalteromonas phage BS5]|uniref:hypothetical protein n=1 Tax=Pseudoalteromonas phage BS5 TaxID=1874539 RepID=UPI0008197CEE|nr:hypothetical protein BOX08_gp47 [Pseudoalteromonas phage BS5]ANY29612.1 hypothetical protein [Pseudoalteromonas phage BS5]
MRKQRVELKTTELKQIKEMLDGDYSHEEIGEELNRPISTIAGVCSRYGWRRIGMSPEQHERVKELEAQKLPYRVIAEMMGKSHRVIELYCRNKLGIKRYKTSKANERFKKGFNWSG